MWNVTLRRRRLASPNAFTVYMLTVIILATVYVGEYPFGTRSPSGFVQTTIPRPLAPVEREVFFECEEPLSRCRFFSVADFFQKVRKRFTDDELLRFGMVKNPNLPAITTLEWWNEKERKATGTGTWINQGNVDLPPSVSFVHVHKCGGSTVHAVLRQVRDQIQHGDDSLHAKVSTFKHAIGPTSQHDKEVNAQLRWDHIQSMRLVFSVIRDPVERFFSGLQQIMHYHDDLRWQCLQRTARATIQCALDFIQEPSRRPYLGDVHLLPMAAHFRLLDEHRVAIFDDVDFVSRYFLNGTTWHERDRSNPHTATSTVLATMGPKDCTTKMLERICHLYEIDLLLRHSLGWESSPWCGDFHVRGRG